MHVNLKALVALQLSKPIHSVSRTRIIHGSILKHPFSDDPFYTTKLVKFYALNGDLTSARNLFDENPSRTIYLWNSIIRAYALARKFGDAFTLFSDLLGSEIRPDNYTFACVARACSDYFHATGLRVVHGKVITYGLGLDLICNSALVSCYSKLGLVDQASQVFCRIGDPDLVLCNTIISAYASSGDSEKGIQMFRVMQNMGMRPDGYTIVGLISGLGDQKLPKVGETIHGFCIKCGLDLNDHVSSVLVCYYSRCDNIDSSCRVFNSLVQPDLVSWSALIAGFSQAGDYRKALHLFRELLMNSGGRPDSILLASVLAASAQLAIIGPGIEIHGYAIRHNFVADIAVSSALIDMYAKCGFLEMGIHVFKIMPRRNIVTYNSVIYGLGLYGRATEAFQLFEEILDMRLKPDETTLSGLLCACCHAGLVSDGREYFRRMKDEFGIPAKTEHYVYMVKLLGTNGYLEEAYNLVLKYLPEPVDSSIWGALLTCCESHKNYELADAIAEQLLENKSSSSSDCRYRVMLSNMFAGDGRWDDVERMRVDDVIGGAKGKMPAVSRAVI